MNSFLNIIKYDYLQRTRSYAFLITLCLSLAMAYTFVPEPNANYSTIRLADYVGYYNSAWFGYVTAIMTSVFLSLIGFYLVNSGIKKDMETKVGQIVAATPIKNFHYLMAKATSNFAVLLTIVLMILFMSVLLFFLYNDGFPFQLWHFIKPYLLIPIPAIFVVSILAVIFEVLFSKYSIVQHIGFFFLFSVLAALAAQSDTDFSFDLYGSKIVTQQMVGTVQKVSNNDQKIALNIGYVIASTNETRKFIFNGVEFPNTFIMSRFIWMSIAIGLLALISPFFHRFTFEKQGGIKKLKKTKVFEQMENEIVLSTMSEVQTNYGIFAFIKTEILLLIRHGKKWLWFVNAIGMLLLALLPLHIAHTFVLPVLWFLQVGRLSQLTTKEVAHGVHYFAFTSYRPLSRLLVSQLLAGIALVLILASPILIRYSIALDFTSLAPIILGGILVVLFAATLGILTKGKKLFEVLFFMVTYANLNGVVFLDYFGASTNGFSYLLTLLLIGIGLCSFTFFLRKNELRK